LKNVIFLDFDGVLRHWTGTDVNLVETSLGLRHGALFDVAFSPDLLEPAILGKITDEKWRENIHAELEVIYGSKSALTLMAGWEAATYKIDIELLKKIKTILPSVKLILTTNATSRLDSDLQAVNLAAHFYAVVNSSEIGYAKPNPEYFREALRIAKCIASECIYVDDSQTNVTAATKLGIRSELYTSAEHMIHILENEC